jgi:tRNA threonylcarbamoyladenosine biosynthesis protein TsaB
LATARRLLAFDAAGAACSAAVWADGRVLARRFEAMRRGQSERLIPMIQAVMVEADLDYAGLEAIAVTIGPGGFTGVRIGLATARGLALACGRPVLGISNFAAVAAAVTARERRGRSLAVLLDAKRADLYAQAFGADLAPLAEPASLPPAGLANHLPPGPLVLAGDAVAQGYRALAEARNGDLMVSAAPGHADAAQVAKLAANLSLPGPDAPPPGPLYLRPPDVTLPPGPRGS